MQPCTKKSYFHPMKIVISLFFVIISLAFPLNILAQNSGDDVISLPIKAPVPENSIKKGHIKAGNNATDMNCDYEGVIADAKEKAKSMGGNIVKITELIPPVFISRCYRIEADVYYCNNLSDPVFQLNTKHNSSSDNPNNYVLLYIYRLKDTTMLAPSYNLHLDDNSVLCFVKSRSRDSIRIYKDGPVTLWGKTMHRGSLKLDTKFGEAYYIRCGLTGGQFNTTPDIELIDSKAGAAEYAKGGKKSKNIDVEYLEEIH